MPDDLWIYKLRRLIGLIIFVCLGVFAAYSLGRLVDQIGDHVVARSTIARDSE